MKKVWFLYVDVRTLGNMSPLLDTLISYECNENKSNLLFAITDNKSYVERFFDLHKREMFLVVKRKMTKVEYAEYLEDNPHAKTEFLLCEQPMTLFAKNGRSISRVDYPAILALHEKNQLMFSYESWDEVCYDFYLSADTIKCYYNALTKKLRKALDNLQLFQYIEGISSWYNTDIANKGNVRVNEWALLKDFYSEVLIGGDDVEDPFI